MIKKLTKEQRLAEIPIQEDIADKLSAIRGYEELPFPDMVERLSAYEDELIAKKVTSIRYYVTKYSIKAREDDCHWKEREDYNYYDTFEEAVVVYKEKLAKHLEEAQELVKRIQNRIEEADSLKPWDCEFSSNNDYEKPEDNDALWS